MVRHVGAEDGTDDDLAQTLAGLQVEVILQQA